jgi:hypothetical protein
VATTHHSRTQGGNQCHHLAWEATPGIHSSNHHIPIDLSNKSFHLALTRMDHFYKGCTGNVLKTPRRGTLPQLTLLFMGISPCKTNLSTYYTVLHANKVSECKNQQSKRTHDGRGNNKKLPGVEGTANATEYRGGCTDTRPLYGASKFILSCLENFYTR